MFAFIDKPELLTPLLNKQALGKNDVPFLTMSLQCHAFLSVLLYGNISSRKKKLFLRSTTEEMSVITGKTKHKASVMTLTKNITFT